jgi:general secretion pathway protein M
MSAASYWQTRAPRERRAMAIGAGAIVLALLVALVWLPLERKRNRLLAELPALRASIASLEDDAGEVRRLRALPPVAQARNTPLAELAANASLPGAQVSLLDAKRVKVSGADVGFAALLEWLADAEGAHGVHVEAARLEALPAAGRVRAELTLARP